MHWTPEHAQGPEQYLDFSFTMSSLAHKPEENHLIQQHPRYEWANDDISALTASNLLKKYAEKYSGTVNSSLERPEQNPYIDAPLGPINEQKNENESWQMSFHEQGSFSASSIDDGLTGSIPAPVRLPSSSRHSIDPRYAYQSHSLTKDSLSPVTNGSSGALKRKTFDTNLREDEGLNRYSYRQQRTALHLYQMPNDEALGDCQDNHFGRNGDTLPVEFKTRKQRIVNDLIDKYGDHGKKRMMSPPYNSEQLPLQSSSSEAFVKFTSALLDSEVADEQDHMLNPQMQARRVETVTASSQLEEQLKSMDSQLLSLVTNEIVDSSPPVQWGDIAGLDAAKAVIEQQILWPLLRPEAYNGANRAPKSILLFGPRGGGKTMLTRCIATHLGATFLKVSGSSFISKWKGDGEMILQAMFLVARSRQPSVIFINELDVMLSNPVGEGSIHLNSIKAKLLSHVEDVLNSNSDHIIVIGGTRHPDDIEETIHRYFIKRLYISPPDSIARRQILIYTLSQQDHCLSDGEISSIVQNTEGYSGSDLMQLCQEAASEQDGQRKAATYKDFENAFCKVRPSISEKDLKLYTEWSKLFGSCV
ncbi:fidgetin-like [Hypanus sabinus]|uniref:fidgetin-like n=1 Tax=Hypanus sabinus TaxID=79690 RepID=UPI0028C47282|nr:fidgetin-like [Hypanus sabinus]